MTMIAVRTEQKTQSLNCESDWEQESWKRINWNNRSDRTWAMNHITWAMNNDRRVFLESN